MSVEDQDRKAAKALVKLGVMDQEEMDEWLEGLEEIDYEGGLLELLLDEERITEKEHARVKKALAAPAKGAARTRKGSRGVPQAKRRERRPSSRRQEPTEGKGKGRLFLVAAAVIILAGIGIGAAVMFSGSGGGGEGGGGASEPDNGSGDAAVGEPGTGPGPSQPGTPGGPGPARVKPPVRVTHQLGYKYKENHRILYHVNSECTNTSMAERLVTGEEEYTFISILGKDKNLAMTCVEHQTTRRVTRGNKDPENDTLNFVEFLRLAPDGTTESERRQGADSLAWAMALPVFPTDGEVRNGTWTLDRDVKEGRFEFEYTVGEEENVNGRNCLAIAVQARFPGGAPPATYVLRRSEGMIWFDKADGVVAKSEAFLDTASVDAEETAPPSVQTKVTLELEGVDEIGAKDLSEIKTATDFYFSILTQIDEKKYNKAFKRLDDHDLSTKFAILASDLMKRIPGIRMSLQAQLVMKERPKQSFKSIAWRRPEHGPAMVTTMPAPHTAQKRDAGLKGKPAPEWLKKMIKDAGGKPSLVYFALPWVGACRAAAQGVYKLVNSHKGSFHALCVLEAKGWREAFPFLFGAIPGKRFNHKVQMDNHERIHELKLKGVPAILVIDSAGMITYSSIGWFPDKSETELKKALGL